MHCLKKPLISSVLALILTLSLSIPAFGYTSYESNSYRIAGQNRYDTASMIAKEGWTQSDYAILVNGDNFPDALIAAFVAKQYNAPILLSKKNQLPPITQQTLIDLGVKKVILIGGKAVLNNDDTVFKQIGIETSRIAGENRYATAIAAASQFPSVSEIVITTGDDFADALSISAIAAYKNMPIILVPKDGIGLETQDYLAKYKANKTYVIGDTDIISENVSNRFQNTERITGRTKYERNINILNRFMSDINGQNVLIATGNDYADALAGAAYAAKTNSPIVLVGSSLSSETRDYL